MKLSNNSNHRFLYDSTAFWATTLLFNCLLICSRIDCLLKQSLSIQPSTLPLFFATTCQSFSFYSIFFFSWKCLQTELLNLKNSQSHLTQSSDKHMAIPSIEMNSSFRSAAYADKWFRSICHTVVYRKVGWMVEEKVTGIVRTWEIGWMNGARREKCSKIVNDNLTSHSMLTQ